MNNPFPCSSKVNGTDCPNSAAFVYRNAVSTQLICDDCAAEYRKSSTRMAIPRNPVAAVALLELLPAREALKMELDRTQLSLKRHLATIEIFEEERYLVDRVVLWADAIAISVGFIVALLTKTPWGLCAAFLTSVGCYLLGRWGVRRYWAKAKLAALNEKFPGVQ